MTYDPLLCSICFDQYDSRNTVPHLATCGHSVCSQCAGKLQNKGDIIRACPFCSEGSFHNSKQNMLAIEVLELIDKAKDEQYARTKGIDDYYENNGVSDSNLQRPFAQLRVLPTSGSVSGRTSVAQFQPPLDEINVKAVFVNNTPTYWTLRDVNSRFAPFGSIENSAFENRLNTNGRYVIYYKEESSASQAIEKMDGAIFDGNQITVAPLKTGPKGKGSQTNQSNITFQAIQNLTEKRKNKFGIRITGIGPVTESELRSFFSRFGIISNIKIPRDNYNQPTGTNLIYFNSANAARNACSQSNGHMIFGVEGKMTVNPLY